MNKINLYGGPGSGKSTLAAEIYTTLQKMGLKVELVREYAKRMVYQNFDMRKLSEKQRIIILGKQFELEAELEGQVDFTVSDSPMLLTAYFHNHEYAKEIVLRNMGKNEYHFWVNRPNTPFQQSGRSHDYNQSLQIDKEMKKFLSECGIKLLEVNGSDIERIAFILKTMKLV